MHNTPSNVFWGRDDTALGVCAALGEDFGFNPIYLRVALALCVYLNPLVTITAYAAAGVVVLASRLLVPNPRVASERGEAPAEAVDSATPENQMELALAA